MVKFAYTAAILQAQIAVSKLDVEGPMLESLVQRACLPFLRRAAMLVFYFYYLVFCLCLLGYAVY
jgi:hypothetical protein